MNDDRKEINIDSGNGFCWAAIPAQEQGKKADDIILTREAIISGLNKIAHSLYKKHLLPWAVWSPIYDHFHRLFTIDQKY